MSQKADDPRQGPAGPHVTAAPAPGVVHRTSADVGPTLSLHIGLPKTATTFLQTSVFPQLAGLSFFDTPQSPLFDRAEDAEVGHRIMSCAVKRSATIWRDLGDTLFGEILGPRSAWTPRDVLISDEGIGRIGSRPALLGAHLRAIARQAERWGFSGVRVVCVFRRQDHWFASHYAQVSDRNPAASQADFESAARRLLRPFQLRYQFGALLDFAALHASLVEAVGPERVWMAPFEQFKAAPDAFCRDLAAFLGVATPTGQDNPQPAREDRNTRSAGSDSWEIRPVRRDRLRLTERVKRRFLHRPRETTLTLTPDLSAEIRDAYRQSNVALARALGIALEPYGYFPGAGRERTTAAEREGARVG